MKNSTKAVASIGVATIGMGIYNGSITMRNDKLCWNPKKGIPGLALLAWGLQLSGIYAADPTFSLRKHFKPTK